MHHAFVFHDQRELHDQAALRRQAQQPREVRIIELVAMIVRMQPDARHLVLTSAQRRKSSSQSGSFGLIEPNGSSSPRP